MERSAGTSSRRRMLGATLIGPGLLLGTHARSGPGLALAQATTGTPPSGAPLARVGPPAWVLTIVSFADPYRGQIQVPQTPPPGTRYVAAEVQVDNGSDQPLDFNPTAIQVRDTTGVEYRGGTAIGAEPAINPRNMNGGERLRGWVWFTVPATAQLVTLVYAAPPPEYLWQLPAKRG